ncbi:nuclear transport factor 2 family protein [Sphingobium sp. TomMM35A]
MADAAFLSGDFEPWLGCFTEDVVYSERGNGISGWNREASGLAEVRNWINDVRRQHLHDQVIYRPVPWHIIDVDRGWVVCEWRNRMSDPGDGSVHEWRCYARLFYADDSKWRFVEEIYNSTAQRMAMAAWQAARRRAEAAGIDQPPPSLTFGKAIADPDEPADQAWPREEIVAAVEHFDAVCARAFLGHDHEEWVDCFTDDVIYKELAMQMDGTWLPTMRGKEAARQWINTVFNRFPIDSQTQFPIGWYVIDEDLGWVVLEWRNQMEDPGNGEHFEERSYTRLKYGGKGQFSMEEDIYDPNRMREMIVRWLESRRRALQRPQTEQLLTLEA